MRQTNFNKIPILDFSQYLTGNKSEQEAFVCELRDVSHNIGFFYLTNHGVSPAMMKEVLSLAKIFFDLPEDDKDKINIAQSPHYRGYGKLNAETTRGIPDFKETYDLGLESIARPSALVTPYLVLHGPNQWPVSLELQKINFKESILQYIAEMCALGYQLMQAISSALGITTPELSDGFNPASEDAYAMLRLLHYPPAGETLHNNFGVGPHIDAGCLVFLLQDEVGGLQVLNHEKKWVDAPPKADAYIVNIGEMLQVWSNHYFKATPHRVINHTQQHRISAPFFFEPNLSTIVKPLTLPEWLPNQTAYKPLRENTAITYGEQMLKVFQRSFVKP